MNPEISRGACKVAQTPQLLKNKTSYKKKLVSKKTKTQTKTNFVVWVVWALTRRIRQRADNHSATATPLSFPPYKLEKKSYVRKKKKHMHAQSTGANNQSIVHMSVCEQ